MKKLYYIRMSYSKLKEIFVIAETDKKALKIVKHGIMEMLGLAADESCFECKTGEYIQSLEQVAEHGWEGRPAPFVIEYKPGE